MRGAGAQQVLCEQRDFALDDTWPLSLVLPCLVKSFRRPHVPTTMTLRQAKHSRLSRGMKMPGFKLGTVADAEEAPSEKLHWEQGAHSEVQVRTGPWSPGGLLGGLEGLRGSPIR